MDRVHFEGHYLGEEVYIMVESRRRTSRLEFYLDHDAGDLTTVEYLRHQGIKKAKLQRCFAVNISGIIASVEAGFGKAVVPKHLLKGLNNIKPVTDQKEMLVPIYLYSLKQPFYSKLLQGVMKELTENLGKFLC